MLAKFLGKECYGYHVDTTKEIAEATLLQMRHVKVKGLKLIKCGHVWVGLYRQATTLAAKAATIYLDTSSSSKITQQPAQTSLDKKRKAEVAALELASKKSKPTSFMVTESPGTILRDNWKTLLKRKRKEK